MPNATATAAKVLVESRDEIVGARLDFEVAPTSSRSVIAFRMPIDRPLPSRPVTLAAPRIVLDVGTAPKSGLRKPSCGARPMRRE